MAVQQITGDRHALSLMLENCIDDLFEEIGMKMRDYSVTHAQIRGICPIHPGADGEMNFTYYFNKGLWFCWSRRCDREKGNDLIGLISSVKGYRVSKSCRWAQRFLRGRKIIDHKTALRIRNIQREREEEEEFDWWKDHTQQKVFGDKVLRRFTSIDEYFEGRNLCPDWGRKFGAGRPPNNWLENTFTNDKVIRVLYYMRKRLVLPVRNISGGIVGFTGRSLDGHDPKWIHFPTKSRFKTSINLFNIDRASKWIRRTRAVLICEGPFDVMKAMMAGYYNCVAVLGLQVHDAHVELLRHCGLKRVILGFDPDRVESDKVSDNISKLETQDWTVRVLRWEGKQDIGEMKPRKLHRILSEQVGDLPNFRKWRQG